jgi:hypothetical protein
MEKAGTWGPYPPKTEQQKLYTTASNIFLLVGGGAGFALFYFILQAVIGWFTSVRDPYVRINLKKKNPPE